MTKEKETRTLRAFVLPVTVLAILLANLFYWGHRHILIHDARGYYELSKIITQNGIFNFSDDKHTMNPVFHVLFELRTYGYPLFLAFCSLFTNQEQRVVQLTVFVIQLLICLVLCYYCARSLQSVFRYPGFGRAVYTATVLNPFLLISTTEVLTDFLSAVVIYLVFVLSIKVGFDLYQEDNLLASQETGTRYACPGVFIVSFLAGFSVMLRPANVSIVAALIFIWSMRAVMTRTLSLKLLLLTVLGLSIPVVPQLVNNYKHFDKIEPLVVSNLGREQMTLGCRCLKLATLADDNEKPQLQYTNPLSRPGMSDPKDFLRKRPFLFLLTLGLHGFALLDQDFAFTYIFDLHPWYRWPLSILNYAFLAFAVYGIYLAARRFVRRKRMDRAASASFAALIMSLSYLGLYLPCTPENRFSLPFFFLLSPFFVSGLFKIRQVIAYRRGYLIARLAFGFVVFVGCCMWLSWWIQLQEPRLKKGTYACLDRGEAGVALLSRAMPAARPGGVDFPGDFLDKVRAAAHMRQGQLFGVVATNRALERESRWA